MEYILELGTNLGNRKENIEKAIEAINSIPYTDVLATSSLYETEPVGYLRQDNFYNIVLYVRSQYEPHEMLGICLGIEAGFGRVRTFKNGPRILDVDIILADGKTVHSKNLDLPHPRYHERRFVLEPMKEIFPDGKVFGINFGQYIDKIEGQEIRKIGEISKSIIAYE